MSGAWYSHFVTPSGSEHYCWLTVIQRFRALYGTIKIKKIPNKGEIQYLTYRMNGEIRLKFVDWVAHNQDPHAIGMEVTLLEAVSGGHILAGKGVWCSVEGGKIDAMDFRWARKCPWDDTVLPPPGT